MPNMQWVGRQHKQCTSNARLPAGRNRGSEIDEQDC